ncbi:hypothetical protein N9W84_01005 [bacterium]|nr:hypothetical protein [bacterium]
MIPAEVRWKYNSELFGEVKVGSIAELCHFDFNYYKYGMIIFFIYNKDKSLFCILRRSEDFVFVKVDKYSRREVIIFGKSLLSLLFKSNIYLKGEGYLLNIFL